MNYHEIKSILLTELNRLVDLKIHSASSSIASTTESKNTATKSSAGDKHETGRAMMERELALSNSQLQKAQILKNDLSKISLTRKFDKVEFGALIFTNDASFFICVGLGNIELHKHKCFAISAGSPMGLALMGREEGEILVFQGREIEINHIV
ncbi:MAG: hypothetical protein COA49_05655 [Bacteroidetes bacterium]|nr:MAG: hypothetical protein COA49_05655 [Bacteroidota bacterium]